MSRKKTHNIEHFFIYGMFAVFTLCLLALTVFTARGYGATVALRDRNTASRELQAYLVNAVRMHDTKGCVRVEDDTEGNVLILQDRNTDYAVKVYRVGADLLEEYGRKDAALQPEKADRIGETGTFIAELEENILRITTDAGTFRVRLRSAGE